MLIPIPYILLYLYVLGNRLYVSWTLYSQFGMIESLNSYQMFRFLPVLLALLIAITSIVAIWMRRSWCRWIYLLPIMTAPAMLALDIVFSPTYDYRGPSPIFEILAYVSAINSPFLFGLALLSVGKKARGYFAHPMVEENAEEREPPPPPSFEDQ